MGRLGYNPQVAGVLKKMNVDTKFQEKKASEERPKFNQHTARVLESLGVQVKQKDIAGLVTEESPLDSSAAAPLADAGNAPQGKPQAPAQQTQPKPNKQTKAPVISLKPNSGQINSLQDVADKITEIGKRMRTIDLLIQTIQSDDTTDNTVEQNKETLRTPILNLLKAVKDLEKLVE